MWTYWNDRKEVLGAYTNQDITLTLPDGLTLRDIKWLAVWCRAFEVCRWWKFFPLLHLILDPISAFRETESRRGRFFLATARVVWEMILLYRMMMMKQGLKRGVEFTTAMVPSFGFLNSSSSRVWLGVEVYLYLILAYISACVQRKRWQRIVVYICGDHELWLSFLSASLSLSLSASPFHCFVCVHVHKFLLRLK